MDGTGIRKRNLSDESSQKTFKFIKFCSSGVSKLSEESANITDCLKASDISKSSEAGLSTKDTVASNCENHSTAKITVICTDTEKKHMSSESSTNSKYIIHCLRQSKNVDLIKTIAEALPKKRKSSYSTLRSVLESSDFKNVAKYCFVPESTSVCCCHFYIGDTLISTGRDSGKKVAQYKALGYGLEILRNLSNLPDKTLSDIKHEWQEWTKIANYKEPLFSDGKLESDALRRVLSEMKNNPFFTDLYTILTVIEQLQTPRDKSVLAADIIQLAVNKSKNGTNVFYFNFSEDPNTLLHERVFHCDLVIGNVLICQAKSSSKRNSQAEAAEQGIVSLTSFFDSNGEINYGTENYVQVNSTMDNNACSSLMKNINNSNLPELCSSCIIPHKKSDSFCSSKVTNSVIKISDDTPPQPIPTQNGIQICNQYRKEFKINERLLRNSLSQNFAFFYSSESRHKKITPSKILHFALKRCSKKMTFNISHESQDSNYRCTVFANQEAIGEGIDSTEEDAKLTAIQNAIKYLQNAFYTIEEKNNELGDFGITREQLLKVGDCKSIISDNNIGHKMLKMMGWTGGGIGKTSGIHEPIIPKGQISHRGLGFPGKRDENWKQNVEQLLENFCKTRTTSELIFSADFTKEERKDIHIWRRKYNLRSASYGPNKNRRLVIRHKWGVTDLLNILVEAGGSTDQYELVDRSSC
ncbi:NF-kappa-B-repressing factor [Trichonephila inaurata madagascariensis]|uniref:NF-kappa-B-repressing factor n=1 Tax=Trichonephila inaurata madagascariensis TaxID=2747483 RepID=A0A8X7CBX7_9ARAC|nr:NF-kappa-B-repressing factor [Trichonephila inaurata madagascariensis]